MNSHLGKFQRLRRIGRRLCSLIVLLQKSPYVQFLLPEAKLIGSVATADAVKMTIATVAGLGAFDSVSGATEVVQISPESGSNTVPATTGEALTFIFQATGLLGHSARSFQVTGTLPPGLSLTPGVVNKTFGSITGTPTQSGTYANVRIRAFQNADYSGFFAQGIFTFDVSPGMPTPASIVTQPSSVTIHEGETTELVVEAGGTSPFVYQWYEGDAGNTTTPVGGDSNSYTTPSLSATTSYWVKVTNAANPAGADSDVATVTVVNLFDVWRASFFSQQELADPGISGPTADPDEDGTNNADEYVFGTSPVVADAPLVVKVTTTALNANISLTAVSASGTGYAGKTRHYAIEASVDLQDPGAWSALAGYSDIIATDQTVSAQAPINTGEFYRVRSWLTP